MEFHGARYLHVLVPCPLGWGHKSELTIRIARLAKETGCSRSSRRSRVEIVSVSKIRRRFRSRSTQPQKRYAHFGDPPRADVVDALQAIADKNIRRFGLVEEEAS